MKPDSTAARDWKRFAEPWLEAMELIRQEVAKDDSVGKTA